MTPSRRKSRLIRVSCWRLRMPVLRAWLTHWSRSGKAMLLRFPESPGVGGKGSPTRGSPIDDGARAEYSTLIRGDSTRLLGPHRFLGQGRATASGDHAVLTILTEDFLRSQALQRRLDGPARAGV